MESCLTLKMKQNVLVCDFLAQKCLIMTTTCTLDMHYMCASGVKKHPDINGENK